MKHPVQSAVDIEQIQFGDDGLVPVIAQDEVTGQVLMLAWANQESVEQSLATGRMTYWSRSREALWAKGDISGNQQALVRLAADCDWDALLATVRQTGPACHENSSSCWSDSEEPEVATALGALDRLAAARRSRPEGRYTDSLLADMELAAAKIAEEADEVGAVLRGKDNDDTLEHEAADLLYHLAVALRGADSSLAQVLGELKRRA